VNEAHNDWLRGREQPVQITIHHGLKRMSAKLIPAAGNPSSNDQWRVEPSTSAIRDWIAQQGGVPAGHDPSRPLSRSNDLRVDITETLIPALPIGLMDLQDDAITDDDLHAHLELTLESHPNLKSLIPADWPKASKYGITLAAMKSFADEKDEKKTRYWHILNLPLCVHYAGLAVPLDKNQIKARSLMQSILRVLEDFAGRFSSLPGARKTLEPLWTNAAWNVDPPEFWSVLATAFMALQYAGNDQTILGFGMKIGGGGRDADIRMRRSDGAIVNVDIEAWHAVKFVDLDPADARAQLLRRVEEKCGKKFRDLPDAETGVAAVVCQV